MGGEVGGGCSQLVGVVGAVGGGELAAVRA